MDAVLQIIIFENYYFFCRRIAVRDSGSRMLFSIVAQSKRQRRQPCVPPPLARRFVVGAAGDEARVCS
jgi:hypothetical protein